MLDIEFLVSKGLNVDVSTFYIRADIPWMLSKTSSPVFHVVINVITYHISPNLLSKKRTRYVNTLLN